MGLLKFLAGTARVVAKASVGAVKLTGHAVHGTANLVASHRGEISAVTRIAVDVSGKVVKGAGGAIASGAAALANGLHSAGSSSEGATGKVLLKGAGYAADAVSVAGKVVRGAGSLTEKAAPLVGGVAGGAVSGVLGTASGTLDSISITDSDFEKLYRRFQKASAVVRAQSESRVRAIRAAERARNKKELLDLLVVGGVTLSEIVRDPAETPVDVQRAFELAYPNLAERSITFAEAVDRLPAEHLVGLVNGVKGKLFEIELVEHLNSGALPEGLHAELASSASQPGYDIRILDREGLVVDVLQAKATASTAYVREALERYPDIDVTTTSEVYAQLVALGQAANVSDSGLSEAALQAKVEAAADSGSLNMGDFVPSSVGLALLALSSFMDKSLSVEERGNEFGDRAAKAGLSGGAAKVALVATNTWWLGLALGVGTRWLTSYGGNKRQRYEALVEAIKSMERRASRPQAALLTAKPQRGWPMRTV